MPIHSIGPYRLEAALGSGGMGRVWRARVVEPTADAEVGAVVALKVIHPHLVDVPGFRERFLREADVGRSVRHENVVRTLGYEQFLYEGKLTCALVMEYVEGQTLQALRQELERVPENLCCHVGREIAAALAAIHEVGIVHRDLKPENVLVTKDRSVVKVMDLGIAHVEDEALRLSRTGDFLGSVHYAAPEQFHDAHDVDGRADLHALGVILYELATGHHPYQAEGFHAVMRKVLEQRPRRPADIHPQLSPFFEEVVLRLLAKSRDDRFASARELAQVLEEGEASAWWVARAQEIRVATRRPLRRIRIARETALHGRDAELARLRSLFGTVRSGEGQVLLLDGEAGIGKSRLIDEFVGLLQREGDDVNFLSGSYPPGGAATAAGAFLTAYRAQFEGQALDEALPGYLGESPALAPAFAALLRGETPPPGSEPLTKDSVQTVFVQVTRALTRERPTIVLIEDLHFAPEEGRGLFASLAFALPAQRLLLVGTMRPGVDERWCAQMQRVGAHRMSLGRLGPKDLIRLLEDAFHSDVLANQLGGPIALKSDGNPFFAFEIIRGLREGQFISRREDGTWVSTSAIGEIQIPSSVLDLVNARVADLDDAERHLLDVAACCGFEFDPLLVGEVVGVGRIPVMQALAKIEKRHRLVRAAGRHCVFDHHQVQEALYGSLAEILREEYHAAIASALEARSAGAMSAPGAIEGSLCVDLARHYFKGGRGAQGLRYLDAALTHLERNYLQDEAAQLAAHALAVRGLVAGAARGNLLLRRAERLEILGRRAEEAEALEEVRIVADAWGDASLRARARTALGRYHLRIARRDEARRLLEEGLALSRESGDRGAEASAVSALGALAHLLGRSDEAQQLDERAVTIFRELGDRRGEALALNSLGGVLLRAGRLPEARARHERALEIQREIGDHRGEASTLGNLGNVAKALNQVNEARSYYAEDLALRRRIGDRQGEAVATANLGGVFFALGRFAEARAQVERCRTVFQELGDRRGEAAATGNLAAILRALGRFDEARVLHEQQLAVTRETGDRAGELVATSQLGAAWASLGRPEQARALQERAVAIGREIHDPRLEANAHSRLGSLDDAAGDAACAVRRHEEALALRRSMDDASRIIESLLDLGDLRRRSGDVERAREMLVEAVRRARSQGLDDPVAIGLALLACLPGAAPEAIGAAVDAARRAAESPLKGLLLWQATRDVTHLREARRLVEEALRNVPSGYHDGIRAHDRVVREVLVACRSEGI